VVKDCRTFSLSDPPIVVIAGVALVAATAVSLPAGKDCLSLRLIGREAVGPVSCPGPLALGHYDPRFPSDCVAITAEVAQLWVAPVRCGLPPCPSFCLRVFHRSIPYLPASRPRAYRSKRLGSVLARAPAKHVSYELRHSNVINFLEVARLLATDRQPGASALLNPAR
jgi:hypothetical protein